MTDCVYFTGTASIAGIPMATTHYLISGNDLNGSTGRLLVHDVPADRWGVQVGTEQVRVKAANLSIFDITKTILCSEGAYELRFTAFAAGMYRANRGETRQEVVESLQVGIYMYVGLNVSFFYEPTLPNRGAASSLARSGTTNAKGCSASMASAFKYSSKNTYCLLIASSPLLLETKRSTYMTSPLRVRYYAFVKMEMSNPCALLLPMLLTDTLFDADNIVAMYARLQL